MNKKELEKIILNNFYDKNLYLLEKWKIIFYNNEKEMVYNFEEIKNIKLKNLINFHKQVLGKKVKIKLV